MDFFSLTPPDVMPFSGLGGRPSSPIALSRLSDTPGPAMFVGRLKAKLLGGGRMNAAAGGGAIIVLVGFMVAGAGCCPPPPPPPSPLAALWAAFFPMMSSSASAGSLPSTTPSLGLPSELELPNELPNDMIMSAGSPPVSFDMTESDGSAGTSVRCERSGTAKKGRETQGKAV
eukprot:SAG22_NODE_2192_length_2858_cov_2.540051_2_plen_172_part_01